MQNLMTLHFGMKIFRFSNCGFNLPRSVFPEEILIIMMIKRLYILLCCVILAITPLLACTSAIVGADANPYGRPLLWKHRDTSTIDNKVESMEGKNGEH